MKYTSRSVKRRVKRRASKSVKRKLKTYSKSKRSFQTGGTIPLNWKLDEQKANVKATWNNVWKPKFPYSFEKLVPVTSTIQAAFGISFKKSNQFTNMINRGLSGTLTIEIDIDKYRHNILKLVNAILQKLFTNKVVEVFKPEPQDDDFEFIASYENFDYYHKSNITEGEGIYKVSGRRVKCNSLGKLTSNGSNPSRHCIIEIDIQFTDTETIIHSIKYTSFVNKNTTCESHGDSASGNFTYWSTTTLKMVIKLPSSSVPREGLETFYAGGGEFYVSTVVFRTDDDTDLEQKYQPQTPIPTIYEFEKGSFDKKKGEQHKILDAFIQARLPESETP